VPTYQYACTECGHAFEQFQSFTDDALTVCPECEGRLRKVFNAVGVVFKGSGFYRNDSRADGAKADASATTGANGSSEKTGDKSSDTSGEKAGDRSGEKTGAKGAGTGSSDGATSSGSSGSTSAA
jgi:putative FmdB family regulatory protein